MEARTPPRVEPLSESDLATVALRFARRVHLGQYRKQNYQQFIEHPIGVARLLAEQGHDGLVLVAAYLHDVIEKTQVGLDEIRERFGPEVAAVVDALSDDPSIDDYGERKRDLRRQVIAAGRAPTLIYAADRVSNIRDWLGIPAADREACAERLGTSLAERLRLWDEDVVELARVDPPLPFLGEIEIGLRELRSEAPATA